ncbi:hypothetical protein FOL47_001733 [Perkinsus chesapeaki]|uniref:Uncharacterized protein n=1 Tax=Perkinsus chesapeaki TaxID=330153 RepID=A0A7J6MHL6_PERCH|nr:hypothetical protein FOL47_001733 [Perkinsus chesapeaki]
MVDKLSEQYASPGHHNESTISYSRNPSRIILLTLHRGHGEAGDGLKIREKQLVVRPAYSKHSLVALFMIGTAASRPPSETRMNGVLLLQNSVTLILPECASARKASGGVCSELQPKLHACPKTALKHQPFSRIALAAMKLPGLFIAVACFGIAAREPSRLLAPRRLATIAFPEGCTPEQKPEDEIFCVTANLNGSGGLRLDLSVNIFDAEDTSKSTHLDLQASFNRSTPTGLNITGGGCADVVKEGFDGVLEGTVELCFEALPEGIGKLNTETGYWHASVGVGVSAAATIFGEDVGVSISDAIDAHSGPNYDLGFVVSLEKSTGDDNNQGLAVGLDLSLNAQNGSLFNWELAATAKLRGWFHPLFDKEARHVLFNREFQIPLR